MDSKGRAKGNIITERFFRSPKHEDIYWKEYLSIDELKTGVAEYMFRCNHVHLHEAFDYRTPAKVYFPAEGGSASGGERRRLSRPAARFRQEVMISKTKRKLLTGLMVKRFSRIPGSPCQFRKITV